MIKLIYKELRLSIHPTMWLFLLFGLMLLIPSYPYYVAFMYGCLAVFFTFLSGRENRDVFYTVLLPIRKRDAVKARICTLALFQLAQIVLSVPLAILSVRINPAGNGAGIDANVAFFGLVFVMFGGFNLIFLPAFYKTAHKLTRGLIWGSVFIFFYIVIVEALAQYIPGPLHEYLDGVNPAQAVGQLPVLLAGVVLWAGLTALAYRISAERFEKVDL